MIMWTRTFWKALAERSLSTGAQAALLAWGGGALPSVSLPWWTVPAAFVGGVALGLLKGIAVNQATGDGPGIIHAEQVIDVH
jgi:hypothetical protein